MSGHSKWHSIKHAKGAADAARGKLFARLARQIEVAARSGGGDIEGNPTLRTMVQKGRDASMPKDNIERAIKRGIGELEGVTYEEVHYEGYAPKGVVILPKASADEDDLMLVVLDAGAEDVEDQGDTWQVITPATELHAVRD